MARIRTIKPDFPFSPQSKHISRDARLFFVESWMLCDREGRYAWEPDRVKAQLFPYDADADLETWLAEIVAQNWAVAYEVTGRRYVWIYTFTDHQRPHPKEPQSSLPACPPEAPRLIVPWNNTARRELPVCIPDTSEPGKETASREKPGRIPSSPVGREGKEILENGEPVSVLSRFPIVKKRNLSAFWEGPVFDIPEAWARKLITAGNGQVSEADVQAFARQTTAAMQATKEPVDTSVHLFAWLDAKWRDWRKGEAVDAAEAQHDRLWQETQARHAREDAEIAAMAHEPIRHFKMPCKAESGEPA